MCGLSVCLWMCERVSVSVLEWVVLSNVETPPLRAATYYF